jgi:hypothetical protein
MNDNSTSAVRVATGWIVVTAVNGRIKAAGAKSHGAGNSRLRSGGVGPSARLGFRGEAEAEAVGRWKGGHCGCA